MKTRNARTQVTWLKSSALIGMAALVMYALAGAMPPAAGAHAAGDENLRSLGDALRKALAKQSSKPTKKRASAVSAAFDAYSEAAEARLNVILNRIDELTRRIGPPASIYVDAGGGKVTIISDERQDSSQSAGDEKGKLIAEREALRAEGEALVNELQDFTRAVGGLAAQAAAITCPPPTINGVLGGGSPEVMGQTGQQTLPFLFTGPPSTCASPGTCSANTSFGLLQFDAYTITNSNNIPQCVSVNFRVPNNCQFGLTATAYLNSFNPFNVCQNHAGSLNGTYVVSGGQAFSFSVPAGASFTIVVSEPVQGGSAGCAYAIDISGLPCTTAGAEICLQDDSDPGTALVFNPQTGAYRFCCGGTTFSGTGTVTTKGSVITLSHNAPDRRVMGQVDLSVASGKASLQSPPGSILCTIRDSNTGNNSCACGPPPQLNSLRPVDSYGPAPEKRAG
ncbi:MAG: hypothetical protein ACLGJB_26645 [Blastocatellia bacterium]